jgi:hypothetical protein
MTRLGLFHGGGTVVGVLSTGGCLAAMPTVAMTGRPQVVSNVTINMVDSTNHIPGANVENKNGCVTTEVKDNG